MNKKLLKLLIVVLTLSLVLVALAACDNGGDDGYAIPNLHSIKINVYPDGTEGIIDPGVLKDVPQELITMSTVNSFGTASEVTYVAYSLTAALQKISFTLPAISKLVFTATDGVFDDLDVTSLANAYITVGKEENGAFVADSDAPRLLTDKNSTSSKSIVKTITGIKVNPANLYVHMVQGSKTNDIAIPDTVPLKTTEKHQITFSGYTLNDIITSMTKVNQSGNTLQLVGEYTSVGFVCADDDASKDYSDRVFTKEEIEGATPIYIVASFSAGEKPSRSFSDLADTPTHRSSLMQITQIVVYNGDDVNCTFELTWSPDL